MSLRSRIVLAVTAVFAGVSLLAGWLMLARAEESLQTAFDRAIQTRAEWLLSLVSVDPVVLPLPTETERMRVVYQAYGRSRELFRSPGFPNQSAPRRHKVPHFYSYRAVINLITTDQGSDGRISLTLAVPDSSLHQDIQQLRWVFGLGWLLSLFLAFGAGYVVAGWLLRPIQAIVDQANTISQAIDSSRITLPKSQDELYQLTDTLNRMLTRIRENVDLQRNFFGAAAHELRTPLTVMKTGLEVTISQEQADREIKLFLESQLDEVNRLTRLVDEFLTLSRPEELAQPLKTTAINVPAFVQACLTQLTTLSGDYEVGLQVRMPESVDNLLVTDPIKLEHILLNLLENAIKYAVAGSVVLVEVQYLSGWLIRVQNQTTHETGPVLDLLQPYFRADPLKEGHGLGLWISHQLTTLLNGRLYISWHDFTFTSELILPEKTK